jgi:hypothetical protein
MGPLANKALCLSTHKHNGKSGTVDMSKVTLGVFKQQNVLIVVK